MAEKLRKTKGFRFDELVKEDKKERLPEISISIENLPEGAKWDPGVTYRVVLDLKMTGFHIDKKSQQGGHTDFDIVGLKSKGKSPTQSK